MPSGANTRVDAPEFLLATGGTAKLAPWSVVTDSELIVALDVEERSGGRSDGVRTSRASAIEPDWLLDVVPDGEPIFGFPGPGLVTVPLVAQNQLDARGYGVEVSSAWSVLDSWRLDAGYALMLLDVKQRNSLEPTARGCRITQSFEIVQLGKVMDRVLYAAVPAHRDRSER